MSIHDGIYTLGSYQAEVVSTRVRYGPGNSERYGREINMSIPSGTYLVAGEEAEWESSKRSRPPGGD